MTEAAYHTVVCTADTQRRFLALLDDEGNMGSDSLLNLALDVYEALDSDNPPWAATRQRCFALRQGLVRAGSQYAELVA